MKRIFKSGAQKRKEAASSKAISSEINKVNAFFLVAQADGPSEDTPAQDATGQQHPKFILPAPAELEDFDISEQERPSGSSLTANMETQNESTRGVGVASETLDLFPQPSFNPFSNDPTCWPDFISNAQRCDIVKRGPQPVDINFPLNAARRRFSTFHYRRVMNNGEIVPRSWLIYSQETDKAFCFCCKLFSNSKKPFYTGSNTWKGIAKKSKNRENGTAHKRCLSDWILLREGIRSHSAVD